MITSTICVFLMSLLCAGLIEAIFQPILVGDAGLLLTALLLRKLMVSLCFVVPPVLYVIFVRGLSLHYLGLRRERWVKMVLLGVAMGIPIAALWVLNLILEHGSSLILIGEPDLSFPSYLYGTDLRGITFQRYLSFEIVNQMLVSISEEVLFRGFLQTSLTERIGYIRGYLITLSLFAILHLSSRCELYPVFMDALFGGIVVGFLYHKTGSLMAPIATHYTSNLLERILTAILKFR